jgi:hypothetical protein
VNVLEWQLAGGPLEADKETGIRRWLGAINHSWMDFGVIEQVKKSEYNMAGSLSDIETVRDGNICINLIDLSL